MKPIVAPFHFMMAHLILFSHQHLTIQKGIFPSKPSMELTCRLFMPYALPIFSFIWQPRWFLFTCTDHISLHKSTHTAGLSCLSATWNCMHVSRPLCYRQHIATGDVHTVCGSCCLLYRSFLIYCVCYLLGIEWFDSSSDMGRYTGG
jgi:hypothetical protein